MTPPLLSWNEWKELGSRIPLLNLSTLPEKSEQDAQPRKHSISQSRTVVTIPLEHLRDRSFELPPRSVAFVICVDDEAAQQNALEFLVPTKKIQQQPWKVLGVIRKDMMGDEDENDSKLCELSPRFPLGRLWHPDSMVETVLFPLLKERLLQSSSSSSSSSSSTPKTEIWDAGAGAGRDVCFLAEELQSNVPESNFRVVGLDQRYRTDAALNVFRAFAERRKVSQHTDWRHCNLNQEDIVTSLVNEIARTFQEPEPSARVHCVYAVRYWNKPFVQALVRALDTISTSCTEKECREDKYFILAVSHFAKPTANASWDFDHPKEHHVLERNELSEMFNHPSWEIRHDEIVSDSDHGRTLIQFVVERTWE